jgi:hypothetical protein
MKNSTEGCEIVIVSEYHSREYRKKLKNKGFRFWKKGWVGNRRVELWRRKNEWYNSKPIMEFKKKL